METRRVGDFIAELKKAIDLLPLDNVDFTALSDVKKKENAILLQLESDQSIKKLIKLLNENENRQDEISAHSLQFLKQFLIDRRMRIHKTDAMYFLTPNSRINRACLLLANKLAEVLQLPAYDLLFGFDSTKYNFGTHGNLTQLKLHEFILDNNDQPLSIVLCFELLEYLSDYNLGKCGGGHNTRYSRMRSDFNPPMPLLAFDEEQLVAHHSEAAAQYYDAIQVGEDKALAKEQFLSALKEDNYCVEASYGVEGRALLAKCTLSDIIYPHSLAMLLHNFIDIKQWPLFLNAIGENDLFRIVLSLDLTSLKMKWPNVDDFNRERADATDRILPQFVGVNFAFMNHLHLRALLFCLIEVYSIARKEGPEYKSTTAYLSSYMPSYLTWSSPWAYPKESKLAACHILRDFILDTSSEFALHEFEAYLRKQNLHELHWGALTTKCIGSSNVLPALVEMMIKPSKMLANKLNQSVIGQSKMGKLGMQ